MIDTDQPKQLDITQPLKVSYCIPTWLRDEQIRVNTALVKKRLEPATKLRIEPCAVVCYGPSLNQTFEDIRDFKYVMTCSGSHKYLVERNLIPTWHIDVDPRIHKIQLIGTPHPDVEYLLASTCHPEYFRMLVNGNFNVTLWHVFDGEDEALRVLPPGEWALTGGCSVGLRALAIARFLGFRNLHVFGMDGSEGDSGKHAAEHPNQAKGYEEVTYGGKKFRTTTAFLEAARQTPHEMDDLKDVTATFHGEGLVQAIMRDYKRKLSTKPSLIAFNKPELITEAYREQNRLLHEQNLAYGVSGGRHAETILKLLKTLKTPDGIPPSLLDYGCGKGYLAKALPFPIFEYDPAISGKSESPRPADLVCCLDVLEHIEPELLTYVLNDLSRCTKQMAYLVIHTGPAIKTLPDGRNTHLIQEGKEWWTRVLENAKFSIAFMREAGPELHVLMTRATEKTKRLTQPLPDPAAGGFSLNFANLVMRDEPYLIGCASEVFEPGLYKGFSEVGFPPITLFKEFAGDRKFSLSSVNNPGAYQKVITGTPLWRDFNSYVRDRLIDQMRDVLRPHGVPLTGKLRARWEFSALPGDGGGLRPHTDLSSKLVTLVLSMRSVEEEWDESWGGSTAVLKPKDGSKPLDDYKAGWEEFDVVDAYPYMPNQCVVFIKGDQSWHGVYPQTGPTDVFRRTLTINIEKQL